MIPNSRGLVAGLVQFSVRGRTWDCMASGPAPIPAEAVCEGSLCGMRPSSFGVRPRCVVVVEKEAVFGRLVAAGLASRVPSVLVTGRGYPDHATRAFAAGLRRAFDVPAFGLCDCDPDGLRILLCYARGSSATKMKKKATNGTNAALPGERGRGAGEAGRMGYASTLPGLQWLGLRPSALTPNNPNRSLHHPHRSQSLSPRDRAVLEGVVAGGEGRWAQLSREAMAEAAAMGAAGGRKVELEGLGDDLPRAVEEMLLGRDWIPLLGE